MDDNHRPKLLQQQQQQFGDPYLALVPSPQPDHLHALQYQQQQATPPPQQQHHHSSLASHFHLLHVSYNLLLLRFELSALSGRGMDGLPYFYYTLRKIKEIQHVLRLRIWYGAY